jgi:cell division inhibitor SulA
MQNITKNIIKHSFSVKSNIQKDTFIPTTSWFEHQHIAEESAFTKQYISLCQKHNKQKKWVLFINPIESSIEELARLHNIDTSQVLMVNFNKTFKNINSKDAKKKHLNSIINALSNGNCSAVVLSETSLIKNHIEELESAAKQGETYCVILEQQHKFH